MRLPAVLLVSLCVAAPAQAAWFGGATLDTGVSALGNVDLDRDGCGAVTYVKGGQVLVRRKAGGVWTGAELVGNGSGPVVAAAPGCRLVVAFEADGGVWGAVAPAGLQPFGAPTRIGDAGGPLHADMGVNGHAYVVWSRLGDVRAARLDSGTAWAAVPDPLDIAPLADAGSGSDRPRVAAGADGNAIVVWGEGGHVWERRLLKTRLSAVPQDAGEGTLPDVDVEDDSSFVPVTFSGPGGAVWRRLVGSAFEPGAPIAGGGATDVAVDGRGMGFAVAAGVAGLAFDDEATNQVPLGTGDDPVVGVGELGEVAAAWRTAGDVRGRFGVQPDPFEAEAVLSRPGLPAPGAPSLAADGIGDAAVAMLQGDALVSADQDRPPGRASGGTTEQWRNRAKPEFRWRAGDEPWGPQTFQVVVDGQAIPTPPGVIRFFSPVRIPDGVHRWAVVATDIRGQTSTSKVRRLRVDTRKPVPKLRRTKSQLVSVSTDALSGVAKVTWRFADGVRASGTVIARRPGRGPVRMTVYDRAGNIARKLFP